MSREVLTALYLGGGLSRWAQIGRLKLFERSLKPFEIIFRLLSVSIHAWLPYQSRSNRQLLNETHFLSDLLTLGAKDGWWRGNYKGMPRKLRIIAFGLEEGNYKDWQKNTSFPTTLDTLSSGRYTALSSWWLPNRSILEKRERYSSRRLAHICNFVGSTALEYWSVALKYGTHPVYNDSRDDCHTIFLFSGGMGGVLVLLRRKEGWNGSDAALVSLCNATAG